MEVYSTKAGTLADDSFKDVIISGIEGINHGER